MCEVYLNTTFSTLQEAKIVVDYLESVPQKWNIEIIRIQYGSS